MSRKNVLENNPERSEDRVKIAVGMIEATVAVCADGIRTSNPRISEVQLLEVLRSRLALRKRH